METTEASWYGGDELAPEAKCYVSPRIITREHIGKVLHDQLDYLLRHDPTNCDSGCLDCLRLELTGEWLLLPFKLPRRRPAWLKHKTEAA